ncbi:hypothetical protein PILCRDRAFT_818989 [Piloderma croceum F 1598]|uniref:Uncharacterized protein n=1 Tax=Piloderma croceum (strain F 1598) TaxID=765440 RepID=A0A0C3FWQ0_PILCF|nr:hypothetical protein PILCRDRAFT_818989 [Piloderma croceum F 1598]
MENTQTITTLTARDVRMLSKGVLVQKRGDRRRSPYAIRQQKPASLSAMYCRKTRKGNLSSINRFRRINAILVEQLSTDVRGTFTPTHSRSARSALRHPWVQRLRGELASVSWTRSSIPPKHRMGGICRPFSYHYDGSDRSLVET